MLITFAFLYIRHSKLVDTEDIKACDAILGSIEWWWLKTDQDVLLLGYSLTHFIKLSPSAQPSFQLWLDYITSSTVSGDDSTMITPLWSFMQSIELTWLGQGTFKQCTISCGACRHQLRRRYVIITIFQYLRLCLTTLLLGYKTQSTWSLGCHIPSKSSTDTPGPIGTLYSFHLSQLCFSQTSLEYVWHHSH